MLEVGEMAQQVNLRILPGQAEDWLISKCSDSYSGLLGPCVHTVHTNLCRNTQIHINFYKISLILVWKIKYYQLYMHTLFLHLLYFWISQAGEIERLWHVFIASFWLIDWWLIEWSIDWHVVKDAGRIRQGYSEKHSLKVF